MLAQDHKSRLLFVQKAAFWYNANEPYFLSLQEVGR
jgi:hypothetical protein